MQEGNSELRERLARAIEAMILPRDAAGAIAEAAEHVVMALMRATEIDETGSASDRRLALEILTPRGEDTYRDHAVRLKDTERRQAGITLFRIYAAIVADAPPLCVVGPPAGGAMNRAFLRGSCRGTASRRGR